MEELYQFARDKLHVDYIFWDYHPRGSRRMHTTGTMPAR